MKLLHVDASILGPNSVSRLLSAEVVAKQRERHPGLEVTYHDLAADPQPHLSALHIAAWHGMAPDDIAVQADLARGSAIVDDLFATDILVIGAPMYNFSIPTQLKAWIDRIVVAGRTFRYTENGPEGLVPAGKKVFLVSTRGGAYGPGSPAASLDHQESFLKGALGFIGLRDIVVVRAEGIAMSTETRDAAIGEAMSEIAALP